MFVIFACLFVAVSRFSRKFENNFFCYQTDGESIAADLKQFVNQIEQDDQGFDLEMKGDSKDKEKEEKQKQDELKKQKEEEDKKQEEEKLAEQQKQK